MVSNVSAFSFGIIQLRPEGILYGQRQIHQMEGIDQAGGDQFLLRADRPVRLLENLVGDVLGKFGLDLCRSWLLLVR